MHLLALPWRVAKHTVDFTLLRPVSDSYLLWLLPQAFLLWIIYRWTRHDRPFALMPRRYFRSRSAIVDVAMVVAGVCSGRVLASMAVWDEAGGRLSKTLPQWHLLGSVFGHNRWMALTIGAALSFVSAEISEFITHVTFHRVRWLWPFHAAHHEAKVLVPLSAARIHPVELILETAMHAVVLTTVLSLWLSLVADNFSEPLLLGAQVPVFILLACFGAARHSPVPISFGRLERFLVSPAMHQIHHSRDPRHYDHNFAGHLAILDRLFGTWMPHEPGSVLEFGVDGRSGDSVTGALVQPFQESFQVVRSRIARPSVVAEAAS